MAMVMMEKSLAAGDAGDEALVCQLRRRRSAPVIMRAGVVGLVGVADVQGDVLLPHREDRPLVQHLRAAYS